MLATILEAHVRHLEISASVKQIAVDQGAIDEAAFFDNEYRLVERLTFVFGHVSLFSLGVVPIDRTVNGCLPALVLIHLGREGTATCIAKIGAGVPYKNP